MKRLLWLLLFLPSVGLAQQINLVICDVATNTACSSTQQIGNGFSGMPWWQSFGVINGDLSLLGGFATANPASPPAIGATTPNTGAFTTLSASGPVTFSGLSSGTQVSCLGVTSGNVVVESSGACATSTASSITPGTTTVSGATAPCLLDNSTGTTLGCATLGTNLAIVNGVLEETGPDRTAASPTVASTDMGGQINASGTLTIPAVSSTIFPAGATLSVVNTSAAPLAVTSTATVNSGGGCVVANGIPVGGSWQMVGNSGGTVDCFQTVSTAKIASVFETTSTLQTTQWLPFTGYAPSPMSQTVAASVVPRAGTVSALHVYMDAAQASGAAVAVTLMDNDTTEAVTCTVAATTSSCTDTTHTFTFAAGDLLEWQTVQTGTGTASTLSIGFLIQ